MQNCRIVADPKASICDGSAQVRKALQGTHLFEPFSGKPHEGSIRDCAGAGAC